MTIPPKTKKQEGMCPQTYILTGAQSCWQMMPMWAQIQFAMWLRMIIKPRQVMPLLLHQPNNDTSKMQLKFRGYHSLVTLIVWKQKLWQSKGYQNYQPTQIVHDPFGKKVYNKEGKLLYEFVFKQCFFFC